MRRNATRPVFIAAAAAALAACGGGALLVLGFIGSAGGDWVQDNLAQAGIQPLSTCGAGGNENCVINIQPVGGQDLFATRFDLSFTSNLPGICSAGGNGSADGRRLRLGGCFTGEYVTINQALSDDGTVRMFFNFTPPLNQGVWVELHQQERRFVFSDNSNGCEIGSPSTSVSVVLSPSNILNPAGPFETTIQSFVIAGQGEAWSGRFIGVSGMRLTRGGEVLELERRQVTGAC